MTKTGYITDTAGRKFLVYAELRDLLNELREQGDPVATVIWGVGIQNTCIGLEQDGLTHFGGPDALLYHLLTMARSCPRLSAGDRRLIRQCQRWGMDCRTCRYAPKGGLQITTYLQQLGDERRHERRLAELELTKAKGRIVKTILAQYAGRGISGPTALRRGDLPEVLGMNGGEQ